MIKVTSPVKRFLTGRWLLPMDGPAIQFGALEVEGERIKQIYSQEEFRDMRAAQPHIEPLVEDYGDAIIMPGLINLHTHIEYTALDLFDTTSSLLDWIPGLMSYAKQWSPEEFVNSAAMGARQLAAGGTTCVLDSSFSGYAALGLSQVGLRGVVALEIFGIDDNQLEKNWQNWQSKRDALLARADIAQNVKLSIAPHAPYTVSPALVKKAKRWAEEQDLVWTMHIGESDNEIKWIAEGDERLDRFVTKVHAPPEGHVRNLDWRACGKTPVRLLDDRDCLAPNLVAAHAVKLTDEDISIFARRAVKVAHCPRSNARLRNGVARVAEMIHAGVAVGFGTDSAASTDNLDLLSEARFAWNLQRALNPEFPFTSEDAVKALTLVAAKAIGMSDLIGSLAPNKLADVAIFNILSGAPLVRDRPYDAVLYGKVLLRDLFVSGRKLVDNPYTKQE